ncbi:MAG: 4Fe-4S ferredoxin [Bryobacteraceae bacterium]|jgi:electron-transferring-flavoprotein dehydrogenase
MSDRPVLDVDIVCVGFGPAMGGFLTTLARSGLSPTVICYERADDIAFGVSGAVTRARGIRASFPDLDPAEIPMAARVTHEKVLYLLDPIGASRRSAGLRLADRALRAFRLPRHHAVELPYTPPFLRKEDGLLFSIGQFNQWVGSQLMASGAAQIWPGTPVSEPLIEGPCVVGARLPDMDVRAALTVVGDGPVGAVGRRIDQHFGLPPAHHPREWAVGAKMVVDLPEHVDLEPGTVFHTFGYPEPEIFGFFYVHPERVASVGIFVPSWFLNPVRTSYRYLQHYIQHPYLWRYLEGGTLRSWGAKSLAESGRRGEPYLAGDGWARIGEGSGSTNVLTGSGVDEAWTTGTQLAEGVAELMKNGRPFTRQNLEETYVRRRRASWVEEEARVAERARDGFHRGVIAGLAGMALAGITKGRHAIGGEPQAMPPVEEYYRGRIPADDIRRIERECAAKAVAAHDALMDRAGWPAIAFDGKLLISQQDALLVGGKVQATPGYPDHVRFTDPAACERCRARTCVEICSGQAITPGPGHFPAFDREKCVHCGACLWNCEAAAIRFEAGAGGLHSAQN